MSFTDTERLDFITLHNVSVQRMTVLGNEAWYGCSFKFKDGGYYAGHTPREAIDAAMIDFKPNSN
jgi:hypothetical protein